MELAFVRETDIVRENKSQGRILVLDSLRGIACCVIAFIWHYRNLQKASDNLPLYLVFQPFYDYGQYFVELFFLLSGFVMALCYRDKIGMGMKFIPYIRKRYAHLYPLFFTTLLVTAVLQYYCKAVTGDFRGYVCDLYHFILNLLVMQTGWFGTDQSFNGPAWCISVEVLLYICFWISTHLTAQSARLQMFLQTLFSLAAFVYLLLQPGWEWGPINPFTMRGVACFYLGTLLFGVQKWFWQLSVESQRRWLSVVLLVFLLFSMLLLTGYHWYWQNEICGQLGLAAVYFPLLVFLAINLRCLRGCFENKCFLFLGDVSMDVYLWHVPMQCLLIGVSATIGVMVNYADVCVWGGYCAAVLLWSAVTKSLFSGGFCLRTYFIQAVIAGACFLFIVPISECMGTRMYSVLENSLSYEDHSSVVKVKRGCTVGEIFQAERSGSLVRLNFYTITWNRAFTADQFLQVRILERDSRQSIYEKKLPLGNLRDGRVYKLELEREVCLQAGSWYELEFASNAVAEDDSVALLLTRKTNNDKGYVLLNDICKDEHIAAEITIH